MKAIKIIFTFILQLGLMFSLSALGFILCVGELASVKTISKSIQEIPIEEILVDEKGEKTPTAVKVYDVLNYANISEGDANVVMKDSTFKEAVGNFISSVTVHQIDESVPIDYPSETEIATVIYNNFDALKESYQIDKDKSEVTIDRIKEEVHKNYGAIRAKLEEFVESLGANNG